MLVIKDLSFSYGTTRVLSQFNFNVPTGSMTALLGESGSGKSTLLQLIYGMHDLDSGSIHYKDDPILGPKFNLIPGDDRFKYVAQDFGLMPYATVAENVGKFLSNVNPEKKRARVMDLLAVVDMVDYADVKPQFLSGGQQQRVALAKALAQEPELILLDEPFSQMDSFRANRLKRQLFAYFKARNISCIMATHHAEDVLAYADQVVILKDTQQLVAMNPRLIYHHPPTAYIAHLFGEVNQLKWEWFGKGMSGEVLVYPHLLRAAHQGMPVVVQHAYFKGTHYVIQARNAHGSEVLFHHPVTLAPYTQLYIDMV